MKSCKYIAGVLLLDLIASNVQAQDLNLNYQDGSISVPLSTTNSMNINPVTGDVNVTTVYDSAEIGDLLGLQPTGVSPGISFNVATNGTSSAQITATITNDAVYCNRSGQWTGLSTANPPTSYVTSVSDTVTANGSNYTVTCANTFGINSQSATVSNIVAVVAPIVSVSANPTSVNSGGSSDITWSVANGPESCTFSTDWPVSQRVTPANSNPVTFPITDITTNKTLTASCTNSAGSDSDTALISVIGTGGASWPSCSGIAAAILSENEDRSILSNGTAAPGTYDGKFEHLQGMSNSFPWPGQFGDSIHLSLTRNQYIAAQFTTSNVGYDAKFVLAGAGNFEGPNPDGKTMSISNCPGDFNEHLNQSRCITTSNTLYWSTNTVPGGPQGFFCELEKNTTYYLNIVHSDNNENNNYATTDCGSSYCGILGQMSEVTF